MHNTAYELGRLFFENFIGNKKCQVLELGSLNINGSLRDFATPATEYMGVDLVPGKSVDRVISDPYKLGFPEGSFDAVVSSSCFEHDKFFWLSFLEICRVIKENGVVYINAPSNGPYHTYPIDCWRFYPDAALALAQWAGYNGVKMTLIESFIVQGKNVHWNDCVMIFKKGEHHDYAGPYLSNYYSTINNLRLNSSLNVLKIDCKSEDLTPTFDPDAKR